MRAPEERRSPIRRWDRFWADQAAHNFIVQKVNNAICNVNETTALMRANDSTRFSASAAASRVNPQGSRPLDSRSPVLGNISGGDRAGQERAPLSTTSHRLPDGSLLDHHILPGPFDMIIQRRTLQLFSDEDRAVGLRHWPTGSERQPVLSHCHDSRRCGSRIPQVSSLVPGPPRMANARIEPQSRVGVLVGSEHRLKREGWLWSHSFRRTGPRRAGRRDEISEAAQPRSRTAFGVSRTDRFSGSATIGVQDGGSAAPRERLALGCSLGTQTHSNSVG